MVLDKYWDCYVVTKYSFELIILSLELVISSAIKTYVSSAVGRVAQQQRVQQGTGSGSHSRHHHPHHHQPQQHQQSLSSSSSHGVNTTSFTFPATATATSTASTQAVTSDRHSKAGAAEHTPLVVKTSTTFGDKRHQQQQQQNERKDRTINL